VVLEGQVELAELALLELAVHLGQESLSADQ
jgi:hypothetical protein